MSSAADEIPPWDELFPENVPTDFEDDCIDGTTARYQFKTCRVNDGTPKMYLQGILYFLMAQTLNIKSPVRNAITESSLMFVVVYDCKRGAKHPSRKPATLMVIPSAWRKAVEKASHRTSTLCCIESLEHLGALTLSHSGSESDSTMLFQSITYASHASNDDEQSHHL